MDIKTELERRIDALWKENADLKKELKLLREDYNRLDEEYERYKLDNPYMKGEDE